MVEAGVSTLPADEPHNRPFSASHSDYAKSPKVSYPASPYPLDLAVALASKPRVAEFFAGVGLVRMALERGGCQIVFANDNNPLKRYIYARNFDARSYACVDVRKLRGDQIPNVEIAAASFPCTDLSLAGNRAGLEGTESSLLFEFLRILTEMGRRKPLIAFIENVLGFATSNRTQDLKAAIAALNQLGYVCDLIVLDARRFVPQSRPRLFIVAMKPGLVPCERWTPSAIRPEWACKLAWENPALRLEAAALPKPPEASAGTLEDVIEPIPPSDERWWPGARLNAFLHSLSAINSNRLKMLCDAGIVAHRTAYRRTRQGQPVWEIRADSISGCLRTSRGGSSKQAVVQAGKGQARVRWMTAREYARLQGAPDFQWGQATESQAKFALGDAVCVPAVAWLARNYLAPAARAALGNGQLSLVLANA